MEGYLGGVGYPCPLNMSLADFCVDVSSIDPRTYVTPSPHIVEQHWINTSPFFPSS